MKFQTYPRPFSPPFEFLQLFFFIPEKVCFWFLMKNPPNVLLVSIFENTLKSYQPSTTLFWPFLAVINFFSAFSKISTKTTFVCLLFLKLKKKSVYDFLNKNLYKNCYYFSFVLALKPIDAQMLFWSIFLKIHLGLYRQTATAVYSRQRSIIQTGKSRLN